MDQCVITFNYSMLYFDMVEMIELIEANGSEDLKDYLESLKNIVNDNVTPNNSIK